MHNIRLIWHVAVFWWEIKTLILLNIHAPKCCAALLLLLTITYRSKYTYGCISTCQTYTQLPVYSAHWLKLMQSNKTALTLMNGIMFSVCWNLYRGVDSASLFLLQFLVLLECIALFEGMFLILNIFIMHAWIIWSVFCYHTWVTIQPQFGKQVCLRLTICLDSRIERAFLVKGASKVLTVTTSTTALLP